MNKKMRLEGEWVIDSPRDKIYDIITDFEKYPEYFPKVAESVKIVKQEYNYYEIDVILKSFGRKFDAKMCTTVKPKTGFVSDNVSSFGTSGHEELVLYEEGYRTKIKYYYQIYIHKPLLRIVAKPMIKWFAMKAWEKAVIDQLRVLTENKE